MRLSVNTDGASRGNPGPSAIGATIKNDKNVVVCRISQYIGTATNNVAEYRAVLTALIEAEKLNAEEVVLYVDSELLCRQLTGLYRVKSPLLIPYYREVIKIIGRFKSFSVNHIMREYNSEADKLANLALDSRQA
jgi:ribonuclease HI